MSRFALGFFGCITLALAAACSGDAKNSDGDRSSDNAGAGTDISNPGSGSGGSASGVGGSSSNGASGGSASTGPTYTAARACEVFARASCNKGVECGLVLGQIATQLICVQCDALSLGLIEQQCQQDSPGDKDAAAVDRCAASISAQACAQACANLDVSDCAVFGDLPTDSTKGLVCDARCANAG